jgi:hypothetical protein
MDLGNRMKLANNIPIWRDANQLLLLIECAVRHFPRYHKYTLGSEMRSQAMLICRLVSRAWHHKSQAQRLLSELTEAVDDMKIQVQLVKELHAWRNFAEFQRIVELLVSVGKQSGGWHRRVRGAPRPEARRDHAFLVPTLPRGNA